MSYKKDIYIFDIDGCILPSIFPSIYKKDKDREQIIKDVNENGKDINLFPEFINFYRFHCKDSLLVFFLTGRQKSVFGELTELQLNELRKIKHFFIIYYPEDYSFASEVYFQWKIDMIQCLFKIFQNGDNLTFRLFDDLNDYFLDIKTLSTSFNLTEELFLVNCNDDWSKIHKRLSELPHYIFRWDNNLPHSSRYKEFSELNSSERKRAITILRSEFENTSIKKYERD